MIKRPVVFLDKKGTLKEKELNQRNGHPKESLVYMKKTHINSRNVLSSSSHSPHHHVTLSRPTPHIRKNPPRSMETSWWTLGKEEDLHFVITEMN